MGRNSLYYIDIVKNNLPSEKTNKVKETNKQINKIEPIKMNQSPIKKLEIRLISQIGKRL